MWISDIEMCNWKNELDGGDFPPSNWREYIVSHLSSNDIMIVGCAIGKTSWMVGISQPSNWDGYFSFSDDDGRKFDFFSEQIVSGLTTQFKTLKKD